MRASTTATEVRSSRDFRMIFRRFVRAVALVVTGLLAGACVAQASSIRSLQGIDADVRRMMIELQVPGAAIGVIRDGKVALARGYGRRRVDQVGAVDADTVFSLASLSKSFTTAAMATLVDEGRLDWDKPAREYLPSFQMQDPVATELMTPRDLVSHRSGLPRHDFLRFSTHLQPAELVGRLRYLPPNQTFRHGYQYNNLMYAAAGYLAGEVAGSTWDELVTTRILEPVGMTRSNTSPRVSQTDPNHATPHSLKHGEVAPSAFYQYGSFGVAPAGAVASTVNDMLKYLQMYLDHGRVGHRQVISTAQVAELHRAVTVNEDSAYALGWVRSQRDGHVILQHGGSIDGFTARMMLIPDLDVGIVALNNLDGSRLPSLLVDEIADRLIGTAKTSTAQPQRMDRPARALPQRFVDSHPTLPLDAYAGVYAHPAYGSVSVARRNADLIVRFDAVELVLTHYHYDVFYCEGYDGLAEGLWQFRLDAGGQVQQMLAPLEAGVPRFVFERRFE